jgi:tetratricopeptide (TPR) repeat protein
MSDAELVDTPQNKLKLKNFHRQFKQAEKEGFDGAIAFARESMLSLPSEIHYRVYLEMADLAKRQHEYDLADRYYNHVHKLEPRAAQGWLDHAKLEEEGGDLARCGRLLTMGLTYCRYNEVR